MSDTNDAEAPPQQVAPVTIAAQYIKDLSFENPNPLGQMRQGGATDFQINLNIDVNSTAAGYEVVLTIKAEARRDGQPAFVVELAYGGLFVLQGVAQEHLQPFLYIEAPRLLFPFSRQILASVTRDGGYAPLVLNPIDFVDLYRRRLAAQGGAASGDVMGRA